MHILLYFIFCSLYLIFYSFYFMHTSLVLYSTIFALSMERTWLTFHCWLYTLCIVVHVTNKNLKLETVNHSFLNVLCVQQNKVTRTCLEQTEGSKWWQNLNFWVNYHFNIRLPWIGTLYITEILSNFELNIFGYSFDTLRHTVLYYLFIIFGQLLNKINLTIVLVYKKKNNSVLVSSHHSEICPL